MSRKLWKDRISASRGHVSDVTLATPPFTLFWHSGVGGHQWTSFELLTAITVLSWWCSGSASDSAFITGLHTTPKKCFNTPVQNTLCRCQFGVKWGKNRGYPYWIFTPNERDLSCLVPDVCAKFGQSQLRTVTVRVHTHSQTHRWTDRDTKWEHYLHRLLRSFGGDN